MEQAEQGFATFTDEEIANLREIFDLFDKERIGSIDVKDLETIMGSLQRDPEEMREFIENIDPNSQGRISFEEFLELMQQVENKIAKSGRQNQLQQFSNRGKMRVAADDKVVDFLRLLEEYRKKCEE